MSKKISKQEGHKEKRIYEKSDSQSHRADFAAPAERSDDSQGILLNSSEIKTIFNLLNNKYKLDLNQYKEDIIYSRIGRRLNSLNISTFQAYLVYLQHQPEELVLLYKELLIPVTSFFENPEEFNILAKKVIPVLFEQHRRGNEIRVWCAACFTGEEAYSIAILFSEYAKKKKYPLNLKIFASDISDEFLKIASQGVYPAESLQHISKPRLKRYFIKHNDNYMINSEIRELVSFNQHNLLTSPSYIKMDLICCKHVLMVVKPSIEIKILSMFHEGLNLDGFLFLGQSESIKFFEPFMTTISRSAQIYKKKRALPLSFKSNICLNVKNDSHQIQAQEYSQLPKFKIEALEQELKKSNYNLGSTIAELEKANEELHQLNTRLSRLNRKYQKKMLQLKEANVHMMHIEHRQLILDENSDGWWEWDLDKNTVYISSKLKEVLGYDHEEIFNDLTKWQTLIHPDDVQHALANIIVACHSDSLTPCIQEIRFIHKNGDVIWILSRSKPMKNKKNKVIGVISTHTNITNLKKAEEKLYHMGHYDELTQLPNRATFIQLMTKLIQEEAGNHTQFALLFMDLDNFKRVNDNLGHIVGDALLRAVASKLKKLSRRADVIARLGGDEFGVILKNVHSIEEVDQITLRYIHAFSSNLYIEKHEIKTSFSIGLAIFPQFGSTSYELLQNADAAMYYAKQHGKNNYYIYDQKVKEKLLRRHTIDTQLQHSIEKKEFSLVYQLKYNLKMNQPIGVEVLIRWTNAKLGPVCPDEFIPIAEENRLIVPIGNWLMGQVIKDYQEILKVVKKKPFSLAVNMSMIHLSEPDFEAQIKQMLENYDYLPPEQLIFELTETALMEHPEIASNLLHNIAKMGIQFSLDDFGTGYSTLQHIKNFPITSLKIDKSFIKEMNTDQAITAMVKAMIAFTKILGMIVTAEGVETMEQMVFLKNAGCDEAQGYLLSKPISLIDLLKLLKKTF